MKKDTLATVIPLREAERIEQGPLPSDPKVGNWYWMEVTDYPEDDPSDYGRGEKTKRRQLLCCTHVGTNYLLLKNVRESEWRVHFKDFEKKLTYEPEHKRILEERITQHRVKVGQLMAQVQEVTAQLGIGMMNKALDQGETTAALAMFSADDNGKLLDAHKKALVKAQEKTLPQLFEKVKAQNALMARWMSYREWYIRDDYERQKFLQLQHTSPLPKNFSVPREKLLNVSAYTPGDFKIFFADPRTRLEYLQWAPLMLTAEDYYAGKVKLQDVDAAWRTVQGGDN